MKKLLKVDAELHKMLKIMAVQRDVLIEDLTDEAIESYVKSQIIRGEKTCLGIESMKKEFSTPLIEGRSELKE
jgi:hypothetical protein